MRTHTERLRRLGLAAEASERAAAADRESRNAEIEAAHLDGMSAREIAREVGMSPSAVHSIVVERTAARQRRIAQAAGLA